MRLFYIRRRFGKIGVVGRQQPHPRAAAVRLDGKVRLSVVCRLVPGGQGDMSAIVLLGSFFSMAFFLMGAFFTFFQTQYFWKPPGKKILVPRGGEQLPSARRCLLPRFGGCQLPLHRTAPWLHQAIQSMVTHPKIFNDTISPEMGKDSSATQLKKK